MIRRIALGGLAVALVVASVVTDARAHERDSREHQKLSTARQQLAKEDVDLAAYRYARGLVSSRERGLQESVLATLALVGSERRAYNSAEVANYLEGFSIDNLHTCLNGVQSAYAQIAAHSSAGAISDLSGVSAACLSAEGGSATGLVYPFDFPDPFVLRVGSVYYAYATNSAGGNIQIIESSDLVHWTALGNALPSLPHWAAPDATWAPAVLAAGNGYVLYYSAVVAGPGGGEQCISAATSPQPEGPFTDRSAAPLVCQPALGGSIDPSPFVSAGGVTYLTWKSNGNGSSPAEIWAQQLSASGLAVVGAGPAPLLTPNLGWEAGVVEAPDMVVVGGRYVLFFSGNDWDSAHYAVGAAQCSGPLGPCAPWSGPVLGNEGDVVGPGGESVFFDASGAPYMAFHAWSPGAVGYPHSRELYIRPLDLSGQEPIAEPAA